MTCDSKVSLGGKVHAGFVGSARVAFALVFSLILINAAKAQQPVEIETDAGVVTTVATVEPSTRRDRS